MSSKDDLLEDSKFPLHTSSPFNFNASPRFSFLFTQNIHRIEQASGCFICTLCPPSGSYPSSESLLDGASQSFSSDPYTFENHLSTQHASVSSMLCVYCGCRVTCRGIVNHILQHLRKGIACLCNQTTLSKLSPLFSCPAEPTCSLSFKTNKFKLLQHHWSAEHDKDQLVGSPQSQFCCSTCLNSFPSLSAWADHIRRHALSLVHCCAPGCLVKSPSRSLLLEHFKWRHSHLMRKPSGDSHADDNPVSSGLILETVEMVCNRPEQSSPDERMLSKTGVCLPEDLGTDGYEPSLVFVLRCPYCTLVTIRWNYFLQHASTCPGLTRNLATPSTPLAYQCRTFWCSVCMAVSTERTLVWEHLTHAHTDGCKDAMVVREHMIVKQLDVDGQAIAPLLPAATDSQSRSNLSDSLSLCMDQSPLNLTALARPSGAACAKLSDLYLGGLGSGMTCADAATPASLALGHQQSSIPFLQSSTAQNTFQESSNSSLTTRATNSVAPPGDVGAASGFVPSEAAMAAVAAALSELTSTFDVNASMSVTAAAAAAALNSIASAAAVSGLPAISSSVLPSITSPTTLASGNTRTPNLVDVSMVSSGTSLAKPSVEGFGKDQVHPEDVGRTGEDIVSFPFDEVKFRTELGNNIRASMLDILVSKMQRFATYCVRILGKENHRRIPVCPECEKVFPYGLGDFKRHLLTVHLEVPREYLKDCLKFTYLPKSEEKFQEVQEQLAMRQMRPRLLEPGRRRIPLPYSIPILRRLTTHLPIQTREFLEQNMQRYSRLSVIVDTRGGFRKYKCNQCSYSSPHALADVRKHILGSHCGISTKHFRHCLQASRLDPVEFTLFTDEKLSRLARNFLHRRQLSEVETSGDLQSPTLVSAASMNDRNGYSTPLDSGPSLSVPDTSNPLSLDQGKLPLSLADDGYVSHFNTVVPGSKNRVTIRIRPPVPPDGSPTELVPSTSTAITDDVEPQLHIVSPTRSSDSPDSVVGEFHTTQITSGGSSLDVSSLPPIPGLEGADCVAELALPFSEPVLRQLLTVAGASSGHISDVVDKMRVYSTYCMTRICRRDRTLAFRCPCGRLFMTTRQPDSKIRAATLADSRRHVMGVHARIPHEFITICCQASRITREYDFQIYPDEMLLRLAMDRPIKLANLPPASMSNTSGEGSALNPRGSTSNPAPLHPLRPLKDLMPHSATPPLSTSSPSSCGNNLASTSSSHTSHRSAVGTCKKEDEVYTNTLVEEDEYDYARDDADEDLDEAGEDTVKKERGTDQPSGTNSLTSLNGQSANSRLVIEDTSEASGKGSDHKVLEDPLLHLTMSQASPNEEVERIIHLPYSSDALYSLVQGYCPPTYFPVLQEKMDIYSSLKVFIARRRGRRYFCCSGCSSSSPHGMGDIRKHILGVHAKVPERYKAAAMHCSRLSREDNTLLPNHVLLHLAKMKWKGTVIKPLAEMDLSQFGSRRATAVGLIRNPAISSSTSTAHQFASQVYQPNTAHHLGSDGDKLTGSVAFYSESAGSGPVDDQYLHSQEPAYTEGQWHVIKMPKACEQGQPGGSFYACSGCSFTSINLKAVRAHIVRIHMHLPVHRCAHCDASFTTRKEAVNHHQQAHTELEFFFGQYLPAYRSAMAKLSIVDASAESIHPTVDSAKCHQFADELSETTGNIMLSQDRIHNEDIVMDNEDYEDSFENLSEFEQDSQRPTKFQRLNEHPPGVPGRPMINGTSTRTIGSSRQHLVNGRRSSSSSLSNQSPIAQPSAYSEPHERPLSLSGSSRRKPSKMKLIQLKPSPPLHGEDSEANLVSGR